MMDRPLIFLDTETMGLDLQQHPIWEIALIRREVDGTENAFYAQILDDYGSMYPIPDGLPEPFRSDVARRYDAMDPRALTRDRVWGKLKPFFRDKPMVVGANPHFDLDRIAFWIGQLNWYYRTVDVEAMAAGFHQQIIGGLSDIATYMGISTTGAHTAIGDMNMVMRIFDTIMSPGNTVRPLVSYENQVMLAESLLKGQGITATRNSATNGNRDELIQDLIDFDY